MDDEQQKNDFAERLQRIRANRGNALSHRVGLGEEPERASLDPAYVAEIDQEFPPAPQKKSAFGAVRMTLIVVTLIAMGAVAFVFQGGSGVLETALAGGTARPSAQEQVSGRVVQAIPPLKVPQSAVAPSGPDKLIQVVDQGAIFHRTIVATPDGANLTVADIASGFDPEANDPLPGNVAFFDPNDTCTFRRPAPDEIVRNVRLERGIGDTDLHVLNDAAMIEALVGHVENVSDGKTGYTEGATADGRMRRVDVFVTDRDGPVYLVLQSMRGNTLWNVHRGPGVQIAHVAVIGETSGVVLPRNVTHEALRISDFVTNFEFGANDTVRPCMIAPFRKPAADWPAAQKAAQNNMLYVNQMHSYTTGHAAFNAWYKETFGVDAGFGLTEAVGAAHVLVGPMPTSPLGYRTLQGRTARVTRAEHVFEGDGEVLAAHRDMLALAVGGDLQNLNPPAMGALP